MDPGGLLGMTRHSQPCKVWICLLFLGLGRHSLSLKHFPAPGLVVQVGLEPICVWGQSLSLAIVHK